MEVHLVDFGTGGASRAGLACSSTGDEARSVIRRGFDFAANYVDAAKHYRNAHVLCDAFSSHGNGAVVSSQVAIFAPPLDSLQTDGQEISDAEVSYRLAAHDPGEHVVLVKAGNLAHLEEDVAALNRGSLPRESRERNVKTSGRLMESLHSTAGRENGPL